MIPTQAISRAYIVRQVLEMTGGVDGKTGAQDEAAGDRQITS